MPTSFSCQRSSVPLICFRSERLRSRRSAVSVWSRFRDLKNLLDNKKPGFERRAIPSIPWATHSVRPLGRMCSMLGCFLSGVGNQPHLIMVGRPGPSATFPRIQPPPTSGEYSRIQNSVKLHSRFFYVRLTHPGVNSTVPVEIQGSTQAFVAQALLPVSFC